jgi:hypothetical protein
VTSVQGQTSSGYTVSFFTTESDQLSNPEHQEVNILSLPSSTLTSTNQQLFSYPEKINVPENQQV